MIIAMIGTGYVGLVTGTCFAESGNSVICVDIDQQKVDDLRKGVIPIYEPGLTELVLRNAEAGRLTYTTNYAEAIPTADCVFIAVGTPQSDDGSADLTGLWNVAKSLAPHLREDVVVIIKSTVPVGTNRELARRLKDLTGRDVDVASNPEFLKEGAAIKDFTSPDRVVVGVTSQRAADLLRELYQPFLSTDHPFLEMDLESAEMTKYVANCMLATKISFINEMANLCERVGADINDVRRGIGHDQRIGFHFLFPGVGYGGSCFPKDVRALIQVAQRTNMDARILKTVDEVNNSQKEVLFEKLRRYFNGELAGKTIAVWGLSFKPGTDDMREAPALVLIGRLLAAGSVVQVFDPVSMNKAKQELGDRVKYCPHHNDALRGADALAIVTDWAEFRTPDFAVMKKLLKSPVIFDGRNLYDPRKMEAAGFRYSGIGLDNFGQHGQ